MSMKALWFKLLRSRWRVTMLVIAVAISTASNTAFNAIPDLSTNYPYIASGLWVIIVILAVLLVLAERLTGDLEWKARIFRFNKKVLIVTGALQDRHGNYDIPYYDLKSAELMAETLGSIGIKSQIDHCKSHFIPRNMGDNMILICGPVVNYFSAEINRRLSSETPWFNGFYFGQLIPPEQSKQDVPEMEWGICHRGIAKLEIPFAEFPPQGRTEDCGIIYIGPNPINSDRWIIWVAGLGAFATYGAAKAFQNPIFLELLGRGLFSEQRYCSSLIQYRFDLENPVNGAVSNIIVTGGSVNTN
ncbi:MAG: hypothetical protein WAZ19_12225 [Anaerolineae bacterium]